MRRAPRLWSGAWVLVEWRFGYLAHFPHPQAEFVGVDILTGAQL